MSNIIEREDNQSTAVSTTEQSPMRLVEMAINQNADVDKLEKLMAMQERWEANEARKAFNKAMSDFQAKCPRIVKSKAGHGYKYATLGDIQAQIRDVAKECGISWRWEMNETTGDMLTVKCIITHVLGHSQETESTTFIEPPNKMQSRTQMMGVATTYGQRYSLIGALGLSTADEDMDGRLPDEFKINKPVTEQTVIQINEYLQAQERDKDAVIKWLSSKYQRGIKSLSELTQHEADKFLTSLKAQEKNK